MMMTDIVGIVGTNRPSSRSAQVARALASIYDRLGERWEAIDLIDLPPAVFEPSAYARKPPGFAPFERKVVEARGLVVIVPEYNGGPPGVLKYFIDMLPFPRSLDLKPVCFIGLSEGMWGGLRAVEHMQQIFGYRRAHIFPERVFIPRCSLAFDPSERLGDGEIAQRLERQAREYLSFVAALESSPVMAADFHG
jgi:chromate reductase, NAD(P)H dehydrogenase (quinone)